MTQNITDNQDENDDNVVQPITWAVDKIPEEIRHVYALRMPNEWRDAISTLEKIDEVSPPTNSLQDALPGLAPEIIHSFWPFWKDPKDRPEYWLVAEAPQDSHDTINNEKLLLAVKSWLNTCYGSQRAGAVNKILDVHKPSWEAVDLHEASGAFRKAVLPGLAVRYLLRHGFQFVLQDGEGNPATWPVLLTTGSYGEAELLTEVVEGRNYSYALQFRTHIVPGSAAIYLLCRTSIRRWVDTPVKKASGYIDLVFNRKKSVYIRRKSASWLSKQLPQASYLRLKVKRKNKDVIWDGRQHQVLKDLSAFGEIPELEDLLLAPQQYQPNILIVYDNWMGVSHPIQPGLESADHHEVFTHLDQLLPFEPMPLWSKVDTRRRLKPSHAAEASYRDKDGNIVIPVEARQEALRRILPARIETNITDFARFRTEVLDIVGLSTLETTKQDTFKLPGWHDNEILEIVKSELAPNLFEELSDTAANGGDAQKSAENRRARDVAEASKNVSTMVANTGFLVEMKNYREIYGKDSRNARRDPKRAVRWGLAKANRVSQNLLPEAEEDEADFDDESDDNYDIRLQNAGRDLLRQMGFQLNLMYSGFRNTYLPSQLDLFAFWIVQHNARSFGEKKRIVPVAIHAPYKETGLHVCLPGPNGAQWLSYTDALKRAVGFDLDLQNGAGYADYDEAAVRNFFNSALQSRLNLERDTLLILSAHNLRRYISDLKDDNEFPESIYLNGILTSDMVKVRVASLRSSSYGDVPQVYPPENRSKYSGVYANADFPRVFYSVHSLPDHKNKAWRQRDREKQFARNPASLEIALYNLKKVDQPDEWAWLLHRLREESSHVNSPTTHPEPLHSLKKLGEYVLQVTNDES